MAFQQIIESIEQSKSVNFSPIQTFTKMYPELIKRIIKDHEELVMDETVNKCIRIELEVQEKIAHEKEIAEQEALVKAAEQEALVKAAEQEALVKTVDQQEIQLNLVPDGDVQVPVVGDL